MKCTGEYGDTDSECTNYLAVLSAEMGLAPLFCDEVIHVNYAIRQIESDSGSDLEHSELGVS